MGSTVSFGVLGPLEIRLDSGPIVIQAPKQQALLAALLLQHDRMVTVGDLVESIWGAAPPLSADHLVHVYVSGVRKSLSQVGIAGRLQTERAGYRISLQGNDVLDAAQFEQLITHAPDDGAPAALAEELSAALGLWRGDLLANIPLYGLAAAEARRLDELRLATIERELDARLEAGEAATLTPRLEQLSRSYPQRERFTYQLMLALYRCGRQADALGAYRAARDDLRDQHGLHPANELRELERLILQHDPRLAPVPRAAGPVEPIPQRRQHRFRRRSLLLTAGIVVVVVASVIAAAVSMTTDKTGSAGTIRVPPGAVTTIDAASNQIIRSRAVGDAPGPAAYTGALLAVGDLNDRTIELLDPTSLQLRHSVGVPDSPRLLIAAGHRVWIGYGYTGRIGWYDLRSGFLSREFAPVPSSVGAAAMATTPRDLWVSTQDGALVRLDPATLHVRAVSTAGPFSQLAVERKSLWAISFRSGVVSRLSITSGRLLSTIPVLGTPEALLASAGGVWIVTANPGRLYRIDPRTTQITWTLPLGANASTMIGGGADIWIAAGRTLLRVNPQARRLVATIDLEHQIRSLVEDGRGHVVATTS